MSLCVGATETKRSVCEGGRSTNRNSGREKLSGEYSRRVAGEGGPFLRGDVTVGWGQRYDHAPRPVRPSVGAMSIPVHKGELSLHIDRLYVHDGVP